MILLLKIHLVCEVPIHTGSFQKMCLTITRKGLLLAVSQMPSSSCANFSALFQAHHCLRDKYTLVTILKGERQHSSRGSSLTSLGKDEEVAEVGGRKKGHF